MSVTENNFTPTVRETDSSEDSHIVTVEFREDPIPPVPAQEMRARLRAMVAVGVLDIAIERTQDVVQALTHLNVQEIKRPTEIMESSEDRIVVKVNRD